MHNTPRISDEADLIVKQLLDARKRLNRHGLALDWDIAGGPGAKPKLNHLNRAFAKHGPEGRPWHMQRITVGPVGS